MSTRKAIQNSMTGAATNWDWNNSYTHAQQHIVRSGFVTVSRKGLVH